MAQSVWPRDTAVEAQPPLKPVGELTCFVISPFQPKPRFDDLFDLVNGVCQEIRTILQLDSLSCIRSDTITSAGVIHPEIGSKSSRLTSSWQMYRDRMETSCLN